MNCVTVITGNIRRRVLGEIPERQVPGVPMAGEAFSRLGPGIRNFFAEDKDADPPFAAFLHVGRPRSMAGLTPILVGGTVGDSFFGMGRVYVTVIVTLVAALANLHPNHTIASLNLPGGKSKR